MPVTSHQQNLNSYLAQQADNSSQRSYLSSFASGLWSVMTLGLASGATATGPSTSSTGTSSPADDGQKSDADRNKPIVTFLPNLPADAHTSYGGNLNDTQIDSASRLLAWQSCHILLVLSNHCTNESLYNPYRLALFHFTDTQGKHFFLLLNRIVLLSLIYCCCFSKRYADKFTKFRAAAVV